MELKQIGEISVQPTTRFYWDIETKTTVEHTPLPHDLSYVRVSKTYRILKQDREGQENWDANLRNLNDYLASTFDFQITVDYVNEASPEVTDIQPRVEQEKQAVEESLAEKKRWESQLPDLERVSDQDLGSDTFQQVISGNKAAAKQQIENIEDKLDRATERLQKLQKEAKQWRRNGVMLAYIFTTSTAPEITGRPWKEAAEDHINRMQKYHTQQIEQTLAGHNSKFKLAIEEVEEPRVFNRRQHTQLLNPDVFHELIDEHPDIEDTLRLLRQSTVAQFEAFSTKDLEVDEKVVESSKATPAQAVNGLLQSLEAENVATATTAPNNGPIIGTLAGTRQVAGFDPARIPHWYFAGKTGSGKSYLARVILENAASQGYNIIGVTPTDTQALAAAFPSPKQDKRKSKGLAADYYWPGSEKLLDWPESVETLLDGRHMVSLQSTDQTRRETLTTDLFEAVYRTKYKPGEDLIVFIDEAHTLGGSAKDALKQLVKEKRKHNIHVLLATQNPKEFKRHYSDIRTETTTVCLHGNYTNWAENIEYLDSPTEIQALENRQAIFHSMDLPKFTVDVRTPVTQVEEPSEDQLTELDARYRSSEVDVPRLSRNSNTNSESVLQRKDAGKQQVEVNAGCSRKEELSEKQEELVEWIHDFLDRHDEYRYITASKCHRPDGAPSNSHDAEGELEELVELGMLEKQEVERNHNETIGYRPVLRE